MMGNDWQAEPAGATPASMGRGWQHEKHSLGGIATAATVGGGQSPGTIPDRFLRQPRDETSAREANTAPADGSSKTPFAKETGQGPARDRALPCKDATNVDLLPLFKGLFDKSRTTSHRNGKSVPKRRQDGSRVGLKGEPRKYSPFQQLRRKY